MEASFLDTLFGMLLTITGGMGVLVFLCLLRGSHRHADGGGAALKLSMLMKTLTLFSGDDVVDAGSAATMRTGEMRRAGRARHFTGSI